MDIDQMSQAEAEQLASFDPKTAETGILYAWAAMSDDRCFMAVRPTHINHLGILADVFVWDDGRMREVHVQGIWLADGMGGYSLPNNIPMGRYTFKDLQMIANEHARAATFFRSIGQH